MKPSTIVYMSLGQLLLKKPGRVPYHRPDPSRAVWPTYVDGVRLGLEIQMTRCGLIAYVYGDTIQRDLDGVRLDNAELVGRPCQRCWAE